MNRIVSDMLLINGVMNLRNCLQPVNIPCMYIMMVQKIIHGRFWKVCPGRISYFIINKTVAMGQRFYRRIKNSAQKQTGFSRQIPMMSFLRNIFRHSGKKEMIMICFAAEEQPISSRYPEKSSVWYPAYRSKSFSAIK